ncbi:MAG: polysaccharide deacetylase family protein [Deltaproteobacteria bacterium]|nr:polysaccharide deacetylase family protein [Deltaproteobacteria bacterium]
MSPQEPTPYPRDFRGYADHPPDPKWPGQARVAVSLVLNVEEGAELSLADGDERNETVYEIVEPVEGVPNSCLASHFDYGTRVGYWRVMRAVERFGAKCTISASGRAIERSPWLARDAVARGHEVAGHSYRWEGHVNMEEAHERAVIAKTVAVIKDAAGVRPVGWHTKGAPSPLTRRLLVEGGFLYDSDAYDDDLPHLIEIDGQSHVIVPYAFDTNDMRFMAGGNFILAEHFAQYCIDAFETLWQEGETRPALMSVGIHPRLTGRPGRIAGLVRFLEHVTAKGGYWFARRLDIAQHWRALMGLPAWSAAE